MIYKGFEIKTTEYQLKFTKVKGFGIYKNGEKLLIAVDRELAKRVIDARLESGLWKDDRNDAILHRKEDQKAHN